MDAGKKTQQQSARTQSARARNSRRHRRRRRRNLTLFYGLLALFVIGMAVYLSLTLFFKVETVTVEGDTRYPENLLLQTAGIEEGENLFQVDGDAVKERLLTAYPYLESVEVEKRFPTQILITVTEAVPAAALEEEDGYTLISASGRVLERGLPAAPTNFMAVRGIRTSSEDEEDIRRLELLQEILAELETLEAEGYEFVDLTDTLEIVMIYRDRVRVELGNELELAYKLQFVQEVIENRLSPSGFQLVDASRVGEVMTKEMTISPWESLDPTSQELPPQEGPAEDAEAGEEEPDAPEGPEDGESGEESPET